MNRKSVMLVFEGTYPFNNGGVSTWAHLLCQRLPEIDFTLYSVNAKHETELKYPLSENVKSVIQLPLWSPDEPFDYLDYGDSYFDTVAKKEAVTSDVIEKKFLPAFDNLLRFVFSEDSNPEVLDKVFYFLWLYYERYDYKETMRHEKVWEAYTKFVLNSMDTSRSPHPTLQDLTIGMRWIYRFLMPLSVTNIPKTDIVHLTLSGFTILPALIANYKYGSKIMLTEHGVFIRERLLSINSSEYPFFLKNLLIRFSEAIARLTYHKAEIITSVNAFNLKWQEMYGTKREKIHIIHNGIDHNMFCPREKPLHLKDTPTVVAAARIFELKDIVTMIKSCAVVKRSIPNVLYMIYGDKEAVPEYTKECVALIKELGIEENFKLMGLHNAPELIYPQGDISILTSISEGFPYTVLESMGCGIPVVATDVGGVSEALSQDSGIICKPKDAEQIGESVIKLLRNQNLRLQMGENARRLVLNAFTLEKIYNKYGEIYESLISETPTKKKVRALQKEVA